MRHGVVHGVHLEHRGTAARSRIHHHAHPRIGDLQFAGEPGLRHAGHSDQGTAVAFHAVDLGDGLEARTLRCAVDAVIDQGHVRPAGGVEKTAAQVGVERLAEVRVVQVLVRRERVLPAPRVVDDLRRQGERPVRQGTGDAADGEDRNDGVHAEFAQQPDIGPVVDLMGQQHMAIAVAVEEHGVGKRDDSPRDGGCRTVGRLGGIDQRLRLVAKRLEAGAADDGERQCRLIHVLLGKL